MNLKELFLSFSKKVKLEDIYIRDYLPIFLLFGAGADDIKNISNIKDSLGNFHDESFELYSNVNYLRSKFYQWFLFNSHYIGQENPYIDSDQLITPEHIEGWLSFESTYNNLLDFEKDLISISSGVLLFLESPGAIAELGTLAEINDISNKVLVVIKEENYEKTSYISLGPIRKIGLYDNDDNPINTYILPKAGTSDYSTDFNSILNMFCSHVIKNHDLKFQKDNNGHLLILIIDLINMFTYQDHSNSYLGIRVSWLNECLNDLGINNFDLKEILNRLCSLGVIQKNTLRKDTFYLISNDYAKCNLELCKYKYSEGKFSRVDIRTRVYSIFETHRNKEAKI